MSGDQLHAGKSEIVDEENYRKPAVEPPLFCKRGNNAKNEPHYHRCDLKWPLRAEMFEAFEGGVDQIDRENERKKKKDLAVVIEKINLPIGDWLGLVLIWKKERRDQIKDYRRQHQPNEQEKGPMLVFAPPIGDEPDQCHQEKQVQHPQGVDPVVAPPFPGLEQMSEATDSPGDAQAEDDRS